MEFWRHPSHCLLFPSELFTEIMKTPQKEQGFPVILQCQGVLPLLGTHILSWWVQGDASRKGGTEGVGVQGGAYRLEGALR